MENKRQLLIIGAGGHGRVVADIAIKMNKWESILFLDDDVNNKKSMGIDVIGKTNEASHYISNSDIFVAIGNNKTRETLQTQLETQGARIPILIHPSAVVSSDVELAMGTVLMAGAIVNCGSKIGKGCIINTASTIDHDNILEDYVHISPGTNLAGAVRIGKGTWVGIGVAINNNVSIVGGCVIGAGSVVLKEISEPGTYVGIPAKRIK